MPKYKSDTHKHTPIKKQKIPESVDLFIQQTSTRRLLFIDDLITRKQRSKHTLHGMKTRKHLGMRVGP